MCSAFACALQDCTESTTLEWTVERLFAGYIVVQPTPLSDSTAFHCREEPRNCQHPSWPPEALRLLSVPMHLPTPSTLYEGILVLVFGIFHLAWYFQDSFTL